MSRYHQECLYIVNDFDAPQARQIVLINGDTWQYIDNDKDRQWKKPYPMSGNTPTSLARFGVTAEFDQERGILTIAHIGESTAAYKDGEPRRWQGRLQETIDVNPQLVSRIQAIFEMENRFFGGKRSEFARKEGRSEAPATVFEDIANIIEEGKI